MSLLPTEKARYAKIIDRILATADLTTVSAKQIRKGLQAQVDDDVLSRKEVIQELIMERFDLASAQAPISSPSSPKSNGHKNKPRSKPSPSKRSISNTECSDDEEAEAPKKKKPKRSKEDEDARLAAKLQAQENSTVRSTRGGATKKQGVKKRTPKKKSAAKVRADEDSDLERNSDGESKEAVKKGGFHKEFHLSAPLAELVGEHILSRPQTVKKIWEHIRANDLQDPNDKRNILCDSKMLAVFRQEKVHMFTMNKILGKQLYPIEEGK